MVCSQIQGLLTALQDIGDSAKLHAVHKAAEGQVYADPTKDLTWIKGENLATTESLDTEIINALGTEGQPAAAQASKILCHDDGKSLA